MRFEKLTFALKKLTAAEKKRLTAFVQSPYFNTPHSAISLHSYLSGIHQSFAEKSLTSAAIAHAQPRLNTKAIQDKAASELLQVLELFLATEAFQKHPYRLDLCRQAALKEKHLFAQSEHHREKLQVRISASPLQNVDDFEAQHLLTEINESGFNKKQKGKNIGDINRIVQSLDNYYALKKLRYCCEIIHREKWLPHDLKHEQLQPLLHLLAPFNNDANPYVKLFIQVYHLFSRSDVAQQAEAYDAIKLYLLQHTQNGLSSTSSEVLGYALGWVTIQVNHGRPNAMEDMLLWYSIKEKNEQLLEGNSLPSSTYRNIINGMVHCKEDVAQIRQFVEKYTPCLPEPERENNHHLAQGLLAYVQQNFDTAVHHFANVKCMENIMLNVTAKRWFFIAAYEHWKNREALDTVLDNLRKYITHHEAKLQFAVPLTKQFVYYGYKLLKATSSTTKKEIHTQLSSEAYFPGIDWLLEKLKAK